MTALGLNNNHAPQFDNNYLPAPQYPGQMSLIKMKTMDPRKRTYHNNTVQHNQTKQQPPAQNYQNSYNSTAQTM
jgi:hypothetical protein